MLVERWRRIERLFHEALSKSPEARPSFLDEACSGDSGLRADVESFRGLKYVENPVASPDGRYLAFGEMTEDGNAWVLDAPGAR